MGQALLACFRNYNTHSRIDSTTSLVQALHLHCELHTIFTVQDPPCRKPKTRRHL